ncbi:probable serine/threonine-protein kinase nek3 isoform X2 [Sitodiplosis mosellana]|nr:probable serine/threonine-protein kinase nek3 isoform X2 [Sitodiplosis mosellana]
MLSDRLNLADNKKFCDMSNRTSSPIPSNNLTENSNGNSEEATDLSDTKTTISVASAMDYFKTTPNNGDTYSSTTINNNKLITNNNANIKNERFSPPQQMQSQSAAQSNGGNTDAHSSNSRSRSVTPSSHPGTPPQHQPNDLLTGSNFSTSLANTLTSGQIKPEFATARTYSDQLRNFAAKYNALNESNNVRNSLFDSRFNMSSMKTGITKDMTSPENLKRTTTSVPSPISNTANNLISTLFSTFPPTAFPSLIDMRGSQLLLSLAQAAKDSEIKQHILNGPQKRLIKRQTPPIHTNPLRSQQSPPSNANTSPQSRIPLPANIPNTFQLLSLQQKANSLLNNQPFMASASAVAAAAAPPPPSISQTLATATNSNRTRALSPLDLSSASTPIGGKRMKLESSSPSRRTSSPSPTTVQHPKTSCGSSSEHSASDTSPLQHLRRCHAQTDEINSWSVADVCSFVGSIDICAEYVENFREQCIDGSGLPLLTEDHLMHSLNMKLGPALKLRSVLLKKLGGPCPCVSCNCPINNPLNNSNLTTVNSAPSPLNSGRPSSTGSGT